MAHGTMPWQVDSDGKEDFKYQYHPRGDRSAAPKNAPSALNTVIIPNVNLPKVWLDSAGIYYFENANGCAGIPREVQQMGKGGI
jgi:hypothetical protein